MSHESKAWQIQRWSGPCIYCFYRGYESNGRWSTVVVFIFCHGFCYNYPADIWRVLVFSTFRVDICITIECIIVVIISFFKKLIDICRKHFIAKFSQYYAEFYCLIFYTVWENSCSNREGTDTNVNHFVSTSELEIYVCHIL